jgi:protein TonB
MRVYTLVLSVLAHLTALLFVIIAPLVATDAHPEPRRATALVLVTPVLAPPPPPAPLKPAPVSPAAAAGAPVVAPDGVSPEIERPPAVDAVLQPSVPLFNLGLVNGGAAGLPRLEPPPERAGARAPVRVGGSIHQPRKIQDAAPVYPALARAARREGVVILEAALDPDGWVRDVRVIRSVPLLDQAAIDAVRQWRYTPTLLNGEPVSVLMTVTVAFRLR